MADTFLRRNTTTLLGPAAQSLNKQKQAVKMSLTTKLLVLVLTVTWLSGCATATVDLSAGAPKEDTAEISGTWGYYFLMRKDCQIMSVDEQETSDSRYHPPLRVGARTIIVRPGLHKISVFCQRSEARRQTDLEFYAEPGHHYDVEWNIFSSWRCINATDKDSMEVVASWCLD